MEKLLSFPPFLAPLKGIKPNNLTAWHITNHPS